MTKYCCLVHTPNPELKDDRLDPPIGLLYMATLLRNQGIDINIIDLSGIPETEWESRLVNATYYGFSTYSVNYHITKRIRDIVRKKNPDTITIAGGPHATALPEETAIDFDYVVVGEGEYALQNILNGNYQKGIINGIPVNNLDRLPFLRWELVNIKSYNRLINGKKAIPIFSSRGCLYNCNFCTVKSLNRKYRTRSVRHFCSEIQTILDEVGNIHFRIKDDLFGYYYDWMIGFNDQVPEITYDCLLRADYDERILPILKATGCEMVSLGIESGSNVVLKSMNKHTTKQTNANGIQRLNDTGIKTLCWFIVGFPGETWDTIKETVDFINESAPSIVTIYPLIPYPGTEVYCNREKYNLRIIDDDLSHYHYIKGNYDAGYVYETDTLNPEIIREMKQYVIDHVTESEIR